MRQKLTLLTKSLLLLCALMAGSGSAWAEETPKVTLDFTSQSNWNIPTSGTNTTLASFTDGTTTIKLYSTTNYKLNSGYLILGKKDSYLEFPTFSFNVSKIVVTGTSSASESVKQNIYVGETAVSTETTSAKNVSNTYEIAEDYQAAGNVYKLMVTSAHNTQISTIEIYEAAASDTPAAALSATSLDFGEVIFGETKEMTFNITPANLTSNLSISCDNNKYEVTPATIASTETTAQTVTVTAKPTAIDDDMDGTITISGGGLATSKTVTLSITVKSRDAVVPVGPSNSTGKFVKVTDTDDIEDGDYLIVYESGNVAFNGGLTTLDAANNGISVSFEEDGSITETGDNKAAVFTLDNSDYSILSSSGYYIGITSWGNGLKQAETAYSHNAFSIDENGKVIISKTFTGSNQGDMILNYNSNSSDMRFRYYKNGSQKKIQLYKYVAGTAQTTFDVAIGATGWRTLVSSANATLPEGVTAYTVTASSSSSVTLTTVASVKANEPYLLKGNEGTKTLTVSESAVEPTGNLLQISTASTSNGVYVLANGNNGAGFYKWKGGSLGAGRVYLPAPAAAREFLSFGDESTDISVTSIVKSADNHFFDLQGRQVAQPTKGLYIVNGKKVIIK